MKEYDKSVFFILLFLFFCLAFFALTTVPLIDFYEGDYCRVADNIIKTGNYDLPILGGEKLFWFPPLYFWVISFLMNLGMDTIWAVRLPVAFCVALLSFFIYTYCTKIFSERVGYWASLVFMSMGLTSIACKFGVNIVFFVFFLTMFCFCYLHKQYCRMYFFLLLGMFTNGILGLFLPLLLVVIHCFVLNRMSRICNIHLIIGLLSVLCFVFLWGLRLYGIYGDEFIQNFFSFKPLFPLNNEIMICNQVWYYFPWILIVLLPWTGMLYQAFSGSISDSNNEDLENIAFMHIWWLVVLVGLTFLPNKFVLALFLLLPPLAIILGWNLARHENKFSVSFYKTDYIFGLLWTFFILQGIWFYSGDIFDEINLPCKFMMIITFLFYVIIYFALKKFRDIHFFGLLHVGLGVVNMVFFFLYIMPIIVERINLLIYLRDF